VTQPKRPDEIAYFAALRKAAAEFVHADGRTGSGYWGGSSVAFRLAADLGIHENRAFYLLNKWSGKGWIDWGTWVWGGWFTSEAPEALEP
jgi:hypothetical protein